MIRLEMNRKQEAILAAIIVFAALAVFVIYSGIGRSPEPGPAPEPPPPPPPHTFDIVTERIEHHNNLENIYNEQYEAGNYTLKSPFVIRDPYASSPLTALVRFETQEPMMISVHIAGKTFDAGIDHTFDGYNTSHIIPVYGLYPGTVNVVEITARPQNSANDADALTSTLTIETPPVPESFPADIVNQHTGSEGALQLIQQDTGIDGQPLLIVQQPQQPARQPFYFSYVRNYAFDSNGDYRWYFNGFITQYHTRYMDNGIFHIIVGTFENKDAILMEIDMFGRVISAVPIDESYDMQAYYGPYSVERRWMYPAD